MFIAPFFYIWQFAIMFRLKKSREGIGNYISRLARQNPYEVLEISVALRQEY
jgi:hypothetical protein